MPSATMTTSSSRSLAIAVAVLLNRLRSEKVGDAAPWTTWGLSLSSPLSTEVRSLPLTRISSAREPREAAHALMRACFASSRCSARPVVS